MYAIVEIAGKQMKVQQDQTLFVHRLGKEEGSSLSFDKVLLVDNDGKIKVGTPTVAGATVKAKVLISTLKGDKVIVFKKKRRKGYQKSNGHRQQFSKIQIESITG